MPERSDPTTVACEPSPANWLAVHEDHRQAQQVPPANRNLCTNRPWPCSFAYLTIDWRLSELSVSS
eukprot:7385282-Prymnesium_polylepis.1